MSLKSRVAMPVSGAQFRVRFASMASMYAAETSACRAVTAGITVPSLSVRRADSPSKVHASTAVTGIVNPAIAGISTPGLAINLAR